MEIHPKLGILGNPVLRYSSAISSGMTPFIVLAQGFKHRTAVRNSSLQIKLLNTLYFNFNYMLCY